MIIEDLQSTNGTYLNGRRVTGSVPLKVEIADQLETDRIVSDLMGGGRRTGCSRPDRASTGAGVSRRCAAVSVLSATAVA